MALYPFNSFHSKTCVFPLEKPCELFMCFVAILDNKGCVMVSGTIEKANREILLYVVDSIVGKIKLDNI